MERTHAEVIYMISQLTYVQTWQYRNYVQSRSQKSFIQRASYSGLTQPGWPAFALNRGPNL